jgi:hypothetical protein
LREKVAIATVDGKAYFLIVNKLRERNIPFVSLVPGDPVAAEVKALITTEKEMKIVKHERLLIFTNESELDNLVNEIERILQCKEAYEKIVIGIDPGDAIGLVAVADGKIIVKNNCFSATEVTSNVIKIIKSVDFSVTHVSVKIGDGVPVYKALFEALDRALPLKVELEVVGEAGTNRPLKENRRSREIRHISSAIKIAGRTGNIILRKKMIEDNFQNQ